MTNRVKTAFKSSYYTICLIFDFYNLKENLKILITVIISMLKIFLFLHFQLYYNTGFQFFQVKNSIFMLKTLLKQLKNAYLN